MAVLEEIFDEPVYGKGIVGDSFLVGMDPTRKRMAQHLGNIAEIPSPVTRVRMSEFGNIAELPKLRVRMSREGPKIRMARRPKLPRAETTVPTPAAAAESVAGGSHVRRSPKHGITINGVIYPGGEYVPWQGIAAANPAQLAMLGMTPQSARAFVASQGGVMHPSFDELPGGKRKGGKWVTHIDMLPEDMKDLVHVETLEAIKSQAGLDEFISLYNETKKRFGGRIPDQHMLMALAIAGKSTRGHYQEFLESLSHVFGIDGAKVWAIANGILSARTAWMEHTMGATRLVGAWIAAGKPSDRKTVEAIFDKWMDTRKHGTDPKTGPVAYSLMDVHKRGKLIKLLTDPENFQPGMMAKDTWAKTPEFAGSFLEGLRVAIDTHMAKLIGMNDVADSIDARKKWVTQNAVRYGAYKASVMGAARTLGWKPSEVQEAVWSAVLGIGAMKRHGASADEVGRFLTHGTMGQAWDMNHIFTMPELQNVFASIPGVNPGDLENLSRQGPSQGGLQARGLRADQPVDVPDPESFARAVDIIPKAESGAGQGIVPVLPAGQQPAAWAPDESYFKKPHEAPDEKAMKATVASRERLKKKRDAAAMAKQAPAKQTKPKKKA